MTIRTSNMIKWLIHLDHLFLCQLHFHALLVIILKSLTRKSLCPCCNYLPNEHIPKAEKKEYKNSQKFACLTEPFAMGGERTMCKTFNKYLGRTIRSI